MCHTQTYVHTLKNTQNGHYISFYVLFKTLGEELFPLNNRDFFSVGGKEGYKWQHVLKYLQTSWLGVKKPIVLTCFML
jgi:hypothetical protein